MIMKDETLMMKTKTKFLLKTKLRIMSQYRLKSKCSSNLRRVIQREHREEKTSSMWKMRFRSLSHQFKHNRLLLSIMKNTLNSTSNYDNLRRRSLASL